MNATIRKNLTGDSMDPATIMTLLSLASSVAGGLTGGKAEQKSSFAPEQQQGLYDIINSIKGQSGNRDITQNQGYQQGQNWLQGLYNDPQFFQNFEAPLQRQFQEQTIPDLANRFASMGSGGALGSTAFRNQLAREGSNLHTNIANLRGGLQQQGINQSLQYAQQPFSNLMGLSSLGLGTPIFNQYQPPSAGFLGGLAAPFAQGAASIWGQQAGQQAGNPGQSPSSFPWSSFASNAATAGY